MCHGSHDLIQKVRAFSHGILTHESTQPWCRLGISQGRHITSTLSTPEREAFRSRALCEALCDDVPVREVLSCVSPQAGWSCCLYGFWGCRGLRGRNMERRAREPSPGSALVWHEVLRFLRLSDGPAPPGGRGHREAGGTWIRLGELRSDLLLRALQMLVSAVSSLTASDNGPVRTCAAVSSRLVTSPLPEFSDWRFEVTALLLNIPWGAVVTPTELPISCLIKFNFANSTSSLDCQQSKCDFFQGRQ